MLVLKQKNILSIICFLLLGACPLLFSFLGLERGGAYLIGVLSDIAIYASLGISLNIILGQAGIFNMGHAAFYGVGAYTTGIASKMLSIPLLATLPLAGLASGLLALIVALPVIRLKGDYLLVVTIAVVEIVHLVFVNNIFDLTGGENGLAIPKMVIAGIRISTPAQVFYIAWSFLGVTILFFWLIQNSRIGRAFSYIKHDELAAIGTGINTGAYKLLAFAIGACWAGFGGSIFALKMKLITPDMFSFSESVMLFCIVILGGAGNIAGVILGSFLIIGLPEFLREFASARMLIFGAALVAMMIFRPQGILPQKVVKYNAKKFVGIFPCAFNNILSNSPKGN